MMKLTAEEREARIRKFDPWIGVMMFDVRLVDLLEQVVAFERIDPDYEKLPLMNAILRHRLEAERWAEVALLEHWWTLDAAQGGH